MMSVTVSIHDVSPVRDFGHDPDVLDTGGLQLIEHVDLLLHEQPAVAAEEHLLIGSLTIICRSRSASVGMRIGLLAENTRRSLLKDQRHIHEHPLARNLLRRLATGRFTSTPRCSIGAATMKMISSTSITSTSGMTLISASVGPTAAPALMPPARVAATDAHDLRHYVKFRSAMFRNSSEKSSITAAKLLHPVREVVVEYTAGMAAKSPPPSR